MDIPALELPPPRILVVEDEPAIARLLHAMLEAEGYATLVEHTGEDGIESALREMPELIILDLMLPGMDGFEVVKRLRSNARTAHIPVLILSARHDTNDKVRALNSQANDYLTKPFNSDELLARIRTQLRQVRESLLSPLTGLPSGLRIEHAIAQTFKLDRAVVNPLPRSGPLQGLQRCLRSLAGQRSDPAVGARIHRGRA